MEGLNLPKPHGEHRLNQDHHSTKCYHTFYKCFFVYLFILKIVCFESNFSSVFTQNKLHKINDRH